MEELIKYVVGEFDLEGDYIRHYPTGNGHINDTYAVETTAKRYLLQRINHHVFPNVEGLMNNQLLVTEYIAKKQGKADFTIIRTKSGRSYLEFDGSFYRMSSFVENSVSLDVITDTKQLVLAGMGFGRFQRLLDGFPTEKLYIVIPDFHNTVKRYEAFEKAISENSVGKADSVREIIEKYLKRKAYSDRIVKLLDNGELPTRVTHNDTKINNILFNSELTEALAVVDLDTVMPGSVCYDFGDSIRAGTNTADEDERDLTKVHFSVENFEAYAEGFLSRTKDILTQKEKDLLAFSGILLTYECGMRFLTDHLNGDKYFRIHRENHNLDRALTQIRLVEEMEEKLSTTEGIIRCLSN